MSSYPIFRDFWIDNIIMWVLCSHFARDKGKKIFVTRLMNKSVRIA